VNPAEEPGAVLGIDYGRRRLGVAVTDRTRTFVFSRETLDARDRPAAIATLRTLVAEDGITLLVVGYPLNADGSEGGMCAEVRKFTEEVAVALALPSVFVDERYTSMEADEMLRETHKRDTRKRKELRDQRAAALILRTYLDSGPYEDGPGPQSPAENT
jgi:putative Holliday junction resolvase